MNEFDIAPKCPFCDEKMQRLILLEFGKVTYRCDCKSSEKLENTILSTFSEISPPDIVQ